MKNKTCVFCWIKKGEKYLIGKRNTNKKTGGVGWTIPGGEIEIHETITQGIARELKEEVCVEIDTRKIKIINDFICEKNGCRWLTVIVQANWKCGKPKSTEEISDIKWCTIGELLKMDFAYPNIKNEIKLLY